MDDVFGTVVDGMDLFMGVEVLGKTGGELSFSGKSQSDGGVIGTGLPGVFMVAERLPEGQFFQAVDGLTLTGESTASFFTT